MIAKLIMYVYIYIVDICFISIDYIGGYAELDNGVYKPTYDWGASPCMSLSGKWAIHQTNENVMMNHHIVRETYVQTYRCGTATIYRL